MNVNSASGFSFLSFWYSSFNPIQVGCALPLSVLPWFWTESVAPGFLNILSYLPTLLSCTDLILFYLPHPSIYIYIYTCMRVHVVGQLSTSTCGFVFERSSQSGSGTCSIPSWCMYTISSYISNINDLFNIILCKYKRLIFILILKMSSTSLTISLHFLQNTHFHSLPTHHILITLSPFQRPWILRFLPTVCIS